MRQLYLFAIFYLFINNIQAQELKATMISQNEVELEISNPEQLLFFIPYTEKIYYSLGNYGLMFSIYEGDKILECDIIIEHIYYGPFWIREKIERFGSGYFSREKIIKRKYKLDFNSCEREVLKKKNISIEFTLGQYDLHKIRLFKKELKSYYKQGVIFDGELTSNKIPIGTSN
ncbi:hypothetical protein SAMN05421741_1124 [Paenimyroides ummariense]|uniref:Uncharacterized protein n=1 Tax=Paenimyroides ummariense TaxID=913024 RepID=A0A1I5CAN9_9FLAO|nr:hypothetical protein [Paenimyroides ummariense]SFN83701.1 hypothetical protein SAMN05421741_1124 [Paenimyroides ummariense]